MNPVACDQALRELTGTQAVAVCFSDEPPAGVAQLSHPASGTCAYWSMAEQGQTFCTAAPDHLGCAVGAYCHGALMPLEQAWELHHRVATEPQLSCLKGKRGSELRRLAPLRYVTYSPLASSPCAPEVVLVHGQSKELQVLMAAAERASCAERVSAMTLPTCALFPKALTTHRAVLTVGCAGGRMQNGLADGEVYLALPGALLDQVVAQLRELRGATNS